MPRVADVRATCRAVRLTAAALTVATAASVLGGCATLATLGAGAVVAAGAPGATLEPDAPCVPVPPPAGASPAAVAYVEAVNAAMPSWQAIDDTVTAAGFVVHRDDLLAQVQADAPFAQAVVAIDFPPEAEPAASEFLTALVAYDAFLQYGYDNEGHVAAHTDELMHLGQERARTSAALRDALRLPPANCAFDRP